MKLPVIGVVIFAALAPAVSAWRLRLYRAPDYKLPMGPTHNEGDDDYWQGWEGDGDHDCENLGGWANMANSMKWDSHDPGPSWGECQIKLYTRSNCKLAKGQQEPAPAYSEGPWNVPKFTKMANKIASFSVNC
jgi:hypothetical protein